MLVFRRFSTAEDSEFEVSELAFCDLFDLVDTIGFALTSSSGEFSTLEQVSRFRTLQFSARCLGKDTRSQRNDIVEHHPDDLLNTSADFLGDAFDFRGIGDGGFVREHDGFPVSAIAAGSEGDDIAFANAFDLARFPFDVLWVEVSSVDDDHFFGTATDVDVAIGEIPEVASQEPTIDERSAGEFGFFEVPRRDTWSFESHFTDFSVCKGVLTARVVESENLHLMSIERFSAVHDSQGIGVRSFTSDGFIGGPKDGGFDSVGGNGA